MLHVARPPQRLDFFGCKNLAIFELTSSDKVLSSLTEGAVMLSMSSAKAITTLASVAAVACGLFAFSWVSLALLGF
jgi:hypothetical protein